MTFNKTPELINERSKPLLNVINIIRAETDLFRSYQTIQTSSGSQPLVASDPQSRAKYK